MRCHHSVTTGLIYHVHDKLNQRRKQPTSTSYQASVISMPVDVDISRTKSYQQVPLREQENQSHDVISVLCSSSDT